MVIDSNDYALVFAIDKGADLAKGAGPATNRIVGFSLPGNQEGVLSDDGWALFDAAIAWLNPAPTPIPVMVAHWPMDDDVNDVVGDNDGTIVGNVSFIDGVLGGAVVLDTSDETAAILVPDAAELDFGDVDFTISMMIRYPSAPGTNQHELMTKGTTGAPGTGKRYTLFHKGDRMRFEIDNDVSKSSLQVSDANFITGEWIHIVAVRDSVNNELLLYADGILQGTAADTSDDISSGEDMYIGNSPPIYGNNVSEADIDDVRIYDAALTEEEIAAIYGPSIEVAGDLLVDVSAADPSAGTETWVNNGVLGDFQFVSDPLPSGSASMTPGVPGEHLILEDFEGILVVRVMSNADHLAAYVGPVAPSGIIGNGDRSIEAWVADDEVPSEQNIICWGYRGGPEGSNNSFSYGHRTNFGAMGHWGDPFDCAWGNNLGPPKPELPDELPELGKLHHLVYTYDGEYTVKLYVDGEHVVTRTMGTYPPDGDYTSDILRTHPGTINLFIQAANATGALSNVGLPEDLLVNSIRVHDGVLTDEQVLNNYLYGPARW
jgi:hypothetical protein